MVGEHSSKKPRGQIHKIPPSLRDAEQQQYIFYNRSPGTSYRPKDDDHRRVPLTFLRGGVWLRENRMCSTIAYGASLGKTGRAAGQVRALSRLSLNERPKLVDAPGNNQHGSCGGRHRHRPTIATCFSRLSRNARLAIWTIRDSDLPGSVP